MLPGASVLLCAFFLTLAVTIIFFFFFFFPGVLLCPCNAGGAVAVEDVAVIGGNVPLRGNSLPLARGVMPKNPRFPVANGTRHIFTKDENKRFL